MLRGVELYRPVVSIQEMIRRKTFRRSVQPRIESRVLENLADGKISRATRQRTRLDGA